MRFKTTICCILSLAILIGCAVLYFQPLRSFVTKHFMNSEKNTNILENESNESENHCDVKLFSLLTRLEINSPERIIKLLTYESLPKTCMELSEVLGTVSNSKVTVHRENLYTKLHNGLSYFYSHMCLNFKELTNNHDCIQELREDFIECEGPSDWFERREKAVVCQYKDEIAECFYIKASNVCGIKTALLLRDFALEIMQKVLTFKCKVSRSPPQFDNNPMPAEGLR